MTKTSVVEWVRAVTRLVWFFGTCAAALLEFPLRVGWRQRRQLSARARWASRWGRRMSRCAGVTASSSGSFPPNGLLVCNHVSYMDIPVLASIHPQVFLSKSEVRQWPIIGWLTRCAGTIYIVRSDKKDVTRVPREFEPALAEQLVITLFPEGTSSDGTQVLPFRSSLLEPAVQNGLSVTPAWIEYNVEGGDARFDAAYWGDMTFFPHLANLFAKKGTRATVRFGTPLPPGLNRKEMARELRQAVQTLGNVHDMTLASKPDQV